MTFFKVGDTVMSLVKTGDQLDDPQVGDLGVVTELRRGVGYPVIVTFQNDNVGWFPMALDEVEKVEVYDIGTSTTTPSA